MDAVFIEGVAATVAAVIVFCGSIFLLLAMVMGGRLAYFVTASVTLAFMLIMGVVWSVNPLGPVGALPEWEQLAIGADAAELDFGPASQYPEGPWQALDTEDEAEAAEASELETSSTGYLESAIQEEEIGTFDDAADAVVVTELTRVLEQDDARYGAVTFEPAEGAQGEETVVVMEYDAGNPLGPPRAITAGIFVVLVLHLFGLSMSERRARETAPATS